jgi:hypothetical protein
MAFTAEVISAGPGGGGHAVVVPKEVATTFTSKRPPVLAQVNGVEYRSRLMVYGGKSYLGLRKDLLRELGVDVGDQVEIELAEDHQERVVVEPPRAHPGPSGQCDCQGRVRQVGFHPPQRVRAVDRRGEEA